MGVLFWGEAPRLCGRKEEYYVFAIVSHDSSPSLSIDTHVELMSLLYGNSYVGIAFIMKTLI